MNAAKNIGISDLPKHHFKDPKIAKVMGVYQTEYPSSPHTQMQRIIFRENLMQKHLQEILNANYFEVLEIYKIGIGCAVGSCLKNYRLENGNHVIFNWEDIETVLKNGSPECFNTSLDDLIDLELLRTLEKANSSSSSRDNVDETVLCKSCTRYDTSLGPKSSADCLPIQNMMPDTCKHAKNATSIPCVLKHMASQLRSSDEKSVSSNDNSTKTVSANSMQSSCALPSERSLLLRDIDHSKTALLEGKNEFYLGRYPCLRDLVMTKDGTSTVSSSASSVASEDAGNNSPEIIVRPRPYTPVCGNEEVFGTVDNSTLKLETVSTESEEANACSFKTELTPYPSCLTNIVVTVAESCDSKIFGSGEPKVPFVTRNAEVHLTTVKETKKMEDIFIKESSRKGLKNKPRVQPNHCLHLWEFLLDLLNNPEYNPKYIAWTRKDVGEFKLIRTEFIANLWGQSKKRKKMTYEKMARALRYYYKYNVLEKVPHKRLHFRFGKNILSQIPQNFSR